MIVNRVFLLAFVASLATLASSNIIEEETRKLAETIGELELVFSNAMKQIFWSNKLQAEQLIKVGRELEGKELLNTAQIAGFIEATKFAIRHKSLWVVRHIISTRFAEQGTVLYDSRNLNMNMRSEMLPILVSRLILRGYIDADRFTSYSWGHLFKLIEHNLAAYPSNELFTSLAINAHQHMLQLNNDAQLARREFEQVLKTSLKAMNIEARQGKHIVTLVDEMIEYMLECKTCPNTTPDRTRLNTKPMFDDDHSVQQAVDEHVDHAIQEAYVELKDVYDPTPEEQERVTKDDIEQLMRRLVEAPSKVSSGDLGKSQA